MSSTGVSGSTTGNTPREQLQASLDIIRRTAELAQANGTSPKADSDFVLHRFKRMVKKLCEETAPRLESLLVEVERFKEEAQADRVAAESDRAAADKKLADAMSLALKIEEQATPTEQAVAADAQTEAALQDLDEAENAREDAQQELTKAWAANAAAQQELEEALSAKAAAQQDAADAYAAVDAANAERDAANSRCEGQRKRIGELEAQLGVSHNQTATLREAVAAQSSRGSGSRRNVVEAELSSPERGDRNQSKRPSISITAGFPLPSRSGNLPQSVSAGTLFSGPSRPGLATRNSVAQMALEPITPAKTPKAPKPTFDCSESFNMLVLPAEWNDLQRRDFQNQYSATKNNKQEAQVDILIKCSSNASCLLSRVKRLSARVKGGFESKSQCPTCSKDESKVCVYLEDITDPDEETKRFQVMERS